MSKPFNVRVYGICINESQEVLLTDELISGYKMTKFPGGGLEFGEGTIECVIREFKEELAIDVEVIEHFYTTDFFQISAFNKQEQILSIYYTVKLLESPLVEFKTERYDFVGLENQQTFRWMKIEELTEEDLSFPIDKKVLEML